MVAYGSHAGSAGKTDNKPARLQAEVFDIALTAA
jgi:hypothetical protein